MSPREWLKITFFLLFALMMMIFLHSFFFERRSLLLSSQISNTFPSTPHTFLIYSYVLSIYFYVMLIFLCKTKKLHKCRLLGSILILLMVLDFPSNFSENDIKYQLVLQKRLRNRISLMQICISSLEFKWSVLKASYFECCWMKDVRNWNRLYTHVTV